MVRTAEQNAALRAATRETIQTAAVRVFAQRGFAQSTIRDIALEAEVSVGSIYRHYASKDELYSDLLDHAGAGLLGLSEYLSGPGRPVDLVRSFTTRFLADVTAGEGAAEFVVVLNHGVTQDTPPGTADRLLDAQQTMWRAFQALVARGQEAGEFGRGDPAELTACYFATIGGLTTLRLALGGQLAVPGVEVILRTLTAGDPG